jgi:hypothetical protein
MQNAFKHFFLFNVTVFGCLSAEGSSVNLLESRHQSNAIEAINQVGVYSFVLEGYPTERYPYGMIEVGTRKIEKVPNGLKITEEGRKEFKTTDGQLHMDVFKNDSYSFINLEGKNQYIYIASNGSSSNGFVVDINDTSMTTENDGYSDLIGKKVKSRWTKTKTPKGFDITASYFIDGDWKLLRKGVFTKIE